MASAFVSDIDMGQNIFADMFTINMAESGLMLMPRDGSGDIANGPDHWEYGTIDVPGDGSCWFHCISLKLGNNLERTEMIRSYVCGHVLAEWNKWKGWVDVGHAEIAQLPREAIDRKRDMYRMTMVENKGWATNCEIKATSVLLDWNMRVWKREWRMNEQTGVREKFDRMNWYEAPGKQNSPIVDVLLNGNHFQLMVPIGQMSVPHIWQGTKRQFDLTIDVDANPAKQPRNEGYEHDNQHEKGLKEKSPPRQTNLSDLKKVEVEKKYAEACSAAKVHYDEAKTGENARETILRRQRNRRRIETNGKEEETKKECAAWRVQYEEPKRGETANECKQRRQRNAMRLKSAKADDGHRFTCRELRIEYEAPSENENAAEMRKRMQRNEQRVQKTQAAIKLEILDRKKRADIQQKEECEKYDVDYLPPVDGETDDERNKRRRKNYRRIMKQRDSLKKEFVEDPAPTNGGGKNVHRAMRQFEDEQMSYGVGICECCHECRIDMKMSSRNSNVCQRCFYDKKGTVKMFSAANMMDPRPLPDALGGLSMVEEQLICMISPCINVHLLKHGGIASSGHCVAFPQKIDEVAQIFPRLPEEIDIIKVRRLGKDDSSKDFRVRRQKVCDALTWLQANSPPYKNITISIERLNKLPEDGQAGNLKDVQINEEETLQTDEGPAPEQIDHGVEDTDVTTSSGVLLPEKVVNVEKEVRNLIEEVCGQGSSVMKNKRGTFTIPWPTQSGEPLSEYTTRWFFSMAFPTLFPYGDADFNMNRPRTCDSLGDWAEHLIWYEDGRFARHPFFKFIVHNMIQRRRARDKSTYICQQKLCDEHYSVDDLKKRIADGDYSVMHRIKYMSADLRGTPQYWKKRDAELKALQDFQLMQGKGLPTFFATGSCAEFHWKPLRALLEKYLQATGHHEDLNLDNKNVMFQLIQENAHVVGHYFDLRTKSYFKNVMGPVFGVTTYWYRQEFAKSRGMIHWHGLCWRDDLQPNQLIYDAVREGLGLDVCADRTAEWAQNEFALTAMHPGGTDEKGHPRKDLWPPPEGTCPPPPEEENPLRKLFSDVGEEDPDLKQDHLLLTNRCHIHKCSSYCLRLAPNGKDKICRFGFQDKAGVTGKTIRTEPELVKDRNDCYRLEMPRDHPMLCQHSKYHAQGWRANGDISLLLGTDDPRKPSTKRIIATRKYVGGYTSKAAPSAGAPEQVLNDILAAVPTEDITGKTLCTKALMDSVRRDVSGMETLYDIGKFPLYRSSHTFQHVSFTGFRQIDKSGGKLTKSTAVDKYLERRKEDEGISLYDFIVRQGKVPVVGGTYSDATWPLQEEFCRRTMLMHWPGWRQITDVKPDEVSWEDRFMFFKDSDDCPEFIRADVQRAIEDAKRKENGDNVKIEGDEDDTDSDTEKPEWMDLVKPQAIYNDGVTEFEFNDGGPGFDWSGEKHEKYSNFDEEFIANLNKMKDEIQEEPLKIPDVDINLMNEDQKKAFSIIMERLKQHDKNPEKTEALRMIVAGTAGSGKSFLIKCLVKAIRSLYQDNKAVAILCPTGNSANLIGGVTVHSFLKIPTTDKNRDMTAPSGNVLEALQSNCQGVKVLLIDERSLIGSNTLGWMEFMAKYGADVDNNSTVSWGGIPVVVMLGDDVQLPPVCDSPVYKNSARNPASLHGSMSWKQFDEAVILGTNIRQANDKSDLKKVLKSLREYKVSKEQAKWLQMFQWHELVQKYGQAKMDEMIRNSIHVFPTHDLEWSHNKEQLLKINDAETPIAKITAVDYGRHAKTATSDKACGLSRLLYICKGARVMLTSNLCVEYGLFNGSAGEVVDIIYHNGRTPRDGLPDVVLVRVDKYTGPPCFTEDVRVLPFVPIERQIDCKCCQRKQLPFRLGWGTTIHRCQGMTIGAGEAIRHIVIHPGTMRFESRNPGALFVAVSRAKSVGDGETLPDFAWNEKCLVNDDRLRQMVNTETTKARAAEIRRIEQLAKETKERYSHLDDEFVQVLLKEIQQAEQKVHEP